MFPAPSKIPTASSFSTDALVGPLCNSNLPEESPWLESPANDWAIRPAECRILAHKASIGEDVTCWFRDGRCCLHGLSLQHGRQHHKARIKPTTQDRPAAAASGTLIKAASAADALAVAALALMVVPPVELEPAEDMAAVDPEAEEEVSFPVRATEVCTCDAVVN
jgi:hypothetical protein